MWTMQVGVEELYARRRRIVGVGRSRFLHSADGECAQIVLQLSLIDEHMTAQRTNRIPRPRDARRDKGRSPRLNAAKIRVHCPLPIVVHSSRRQWNRHGTRATLGRYE